MALEVVVLAAGKGTRMRSDLPKVLHPVAGRPMLAHVINTALRLNPAAIHVVIGHGAELVEKLLAGFAEKGVPVDSVLQSEQLGTGHAVAAALPRVRRDNDVLVLYGDTPLTPKSVLDSLCRGLGGRPLCVLSATAADPSGYGRIIRGPDGSFLRIVEHKDATDEQRAIREINTGILIAPARILLEYLPRIQNHNNQGEYYLTDLPGLLSAEGKSVGIVTAADFELLLGVNSKAQLAACERLYQNRQALRLMNEGVTLSDPARFDLRGSLEHGRDCFIDANVLLEGNIRLGDRVTIGVGCVIRNCEIAADALISPYTVLEDCKVGEGATVGPFARLRPGCLLDRGVHVGNFVEVKKSHLGPGTKAGHLSYLGDAEIGADVNIGAGTITCNYDGARKFKTVIGNDVFIGSDTQLVAPCTVPDGVTVGAGTTITRHLELEKRDLVITRAPAKIKGNYQRPHKQSKKEN